MPSIARAGKEESLKKTSRGLILGMATVFLLTGCGNKTSAPAISLSLTNIPATLTVNQAVHLTVNVSNDTTNAGVDWSCSPSGSCGTFNPAHTADGGTTTFTAPSSAGTVVITAVSSASSGATASASVTIVPVGSNSTLNGPYVFLVQGQDNSGGYVLAGTIVADGNGNITGGEQDYANESIQAGPDPLTGTYSIGPEGRGSITLDVNDASLPNNGVETFSIAVTSSTHALITQFDATATSSGSLDFQGASAVVSGSIVGPYAFVAGGVDVTNSTPLGFGGVAQFSAATGTVAGGTIYANNGGQTSSNTFTGTITAPDSYGRGTIGLSLGWHFVYYAVQGEVLRLIQEDLPTVVSGGTLVGQGPASSLPAFSNASLTGNYVFSDTGASVRGALALVGQFTADGNGTLTAGFADANSGGSHSGGSIARANAYSIATDGTGSLALPGGSTTQDVSSLMIFMTDPSLNLLDPNNPSSGGGALVLDFESGAVGTGVLVLQSLGTFQGNYAVNLQFVYSGGEEDFVGQTVSDGVGGLTGTVDVNDYGTTAAGVSFAATFTADSSHPGRFTGVFTVGGNFYNIIYYQISGTMLMLVDVDSTDVGAGIMVTE
jgi:hypothetical protein